MLQAVMGGRAFETLRVTATGVLDLFGRMAGRVGGVRAKMAALAKVEPGATLLLPAANMKNECPLDEDGKLVRATPMLPS
jgi:PDZ domain-containing secreted protein